MSYDALNDRIIALENRVKALETARERARRRKKKLGFQVTDVIGGEVAAQCREQEPDDGD